MGINKSQYEFQRIHVDRTLIEELYAHSKITKEAREYALRLLYPEQEWGLWASWLLLMVGVGLILSGILCFFAFNWVKISPMLKLAFLQLGMVGSLLGACFYSLRRVEGQVLLLITSVLVGIFMAVFGQVYQTGADAYQLFMNWSTLTLIWTLISNFTAQWILWLGITNLFLVLWWDQAVLPGKEMQFMIFIEVALFNGAVLAMREYFLKKKAYEWLSARWVRGLLVAAVLLTLLIPIVMWVMDPGKATKSIKWSGMIGLVAHAIVYFLYRYQLPDRWALAIAVFSSCIIVEVASFKFIFEIWHPVDSILLLLRSLITLSVFTFAIAWLRKSTQKMKTEHV